MTPFWLLLGAMALVAVGWAALMAYYLNRDDD
jgi:hypothetical protein